MPALGYVPARAGQLLFVKFDAANPLSDGIVELIDTKMSVMGRDGEFQFSGTADKSVRKSLALSQNPGCRGIVEVPTAAAADQASIMLLTWYFEYFRSRSSFLSIRS